MPKTRIALLLGFSVAVTILASACKSEPKVSFSQEVRPILEANCLSCHQAGGAGFVASGLSMTSYDNLMKGTEAGPMVIAGDVAFHERLLPVMEDTDTAGWIETWDSFVGLGAEIVIPGHGGPTDYEQVTLYTHDYLVYMREKLAVLVEEGGTLQDAYNVDQSPFSHLDTYFELARQNAGRMFREMEFDF